MLMEPFLKRSFSYSLSFPVCDDSALLTGLQMATVVLFSSKASSNLLNNDTYRFACVSNCVTIQTNKTRCALFNLLDEEAFLEKAVVELFYKFDMKSYLVFLKGELIV